MNLSRFHLFIFILALPSFIYAQKHFKTKSAVFSMYLLNEGEDIEAHCNKLYSFIDFKKDSVHCSMKAKNFKFNNALVEEYFLRELIEFEKFPEFTFSAALPDGIDLSEDSTYNYNITGILGLKEALVEEKIKVEVQVNKKEEIEVFGTFSVNYEDYGIKIPEIYRRDLAKSAKMSFQLKYIPEKKTFFNL